MNTICMLSAFDAEELQKRNTRPDCRDHRHCNERKAVKLVASGRAKVVGPAITSGRIGMAPDEFPRAIKNNEGWTITQWKAEAIKVGRSAMRSKHRRGL
jgi:hypothetical protein